MPTELSPLLERGEAEAARARDEAARVHEAAIQAVLRLGAARRVAATEDELWAEAA